MKAPASCGRDDLRLNQCWLRPREAHGEPTFSPASLSRYPAHPRLCLTLRILAKVIFWRDASFRHSGEWILEG